MAQYTADDLAPLDPVKLSGAHLAERGEIFLLQYLSNCEAALKVLPEVSTSAIQASSLVDSRPYMIGCYSFSSARLGASTIQAPRGACYGHSAWAKARPAYQEHHLSMSDTTLYRWRLEELV